MKQLKSVFFLIGLLALAALACGPSLPDVPDGAVETVQSAGEQAGSAAETAVALATQEGSTALETVQAGGENVDLGALGDKFETIQPDENGNFTVTVTEEEVNQAIQRSQQASEGGAQTVQQASVAFTGDNIVLTGNVTQPVEAQLTVTFRPSVVDGVLQFEVVSATLGSITVPAAVLSTAEGTLNSTLGQAINTLPANYTLQSIVMGEGTMTISGTRN